MAGTRENISVLIASQRALSHDLYTQALNRYSGIRVVGSAFTVDQVTRIARAKRTDILLISPHLLDGPLSGFVALQKTRALSSSAKPIVLVEQNEEHLVVPAFRAGARGVFSVVSDGVKKLCRCVKCVHAGQIWASSAHLSTVLDVFSQSIPLRIVDAKGAELLTEREDEVVRLVESGLTNKEIAAELNLSEHTVRNKLFRIFDKLGVSSRVELALYAQNSSSYVPPTNPSGAQRKRPHRAVVS